MDTAVASALAVVMLVPTAVALWPNVPLTTAAVVLPRWYAQVGAELPPGQVVLSYPLPFSGLQSSQAWQAVNRMRYSQAGGGGPEGQVGRAGRPGPALKCSSTPRYPWGRPRLPVAAT